MFAEQLATDLWCSNSFSGLSREIYRPAPRSCIGTPVSSGQAQLLPPFLQICLSPQVEQQLSFRPFHQQRERSCYIKWACSHCGEESVHLINLCKGLMVMDTVTTSSDLVPESCLKKVNEGPRNEEASNRNGSGGSTNFQEISMASVPRKDDPDISWVLHGSNGLRS